jgi:hypothetical protein
MYDFTVSLLLLGCAFCAGILTYRNNAQLFEDCFSWLSLKWTELGAKIRLW